MRTGSSTVYALIDKETGATVHFGWGPLRDPLKPYRHVAEAKHLVEAVEITGRLTLRNMIGGHGINRLDAVRLCDAFHGPRKNAGGHGLRIAVYKQGGTKYYTTLTAAAAAMGVSRQNMAWNLHYLSDTAIFVRR